MSEAPIIPTSHRSLLQITPAACECKTVFLRFSCGHEFLRTQSCDEITSPHEEYEHPRRKVILESQDVCAECVLTTTPDHDQLTVQVAAGELSEHVSPSKKKASGGYCGNNEGLQELSIDLDCDLDTQTFEDIFNSRRRSYGDPNMTVDDREVADSTSYTDTYQLPAATYNPHAPGNVSIADDQNNYQNLVRQDNIANWTEETNEFFDIEPSNQNLLFDWLRAEVLQASEDHKDDKGLVNPISPLQHLDDPYDTSASSCARTSNGTIRRYNLGADICPATMGCFPRNDTGSATEHKSLLSPPNADQVLHLTKTRSVSWPIIPVIHVTKAGPPPSMFSRIRVPKKSLPKKIKSSINKGYRIVSAKLFTKRGIDGRVLQRRKPITFRSGSLFSRTGTRAERKADALRSKMLERKYSEQGYYEVVASGMSWSDYSDKAEDPPRNFTQQVSAREGELAEEGAKSWATYST